MTVQKRFELHKGSLNNVIPIYRWLLLDASVMDIAEDCVDISMGRAFNDALSKGALKGTLLPLYRDISNVNSTT